MCVNVSVVHIGCGDSLRKLAKSFKIHRNTIRQILNTHQETGQIASLLARLFTHRDVFRSDQARPALETEIHHLKVSR